MAPEKSGDTVTEKVEERLDILFSEDDNQTGEKPNSTDESKYPLRELKTIVLSIDWEITDEVMKKFVEQVVLLKETYKNDKIILVFLQLLGSIGEYIRVNLGRSHPDAFNLLNSSFNNLDKIFKTTDLTDLEKKKLLSVELSRYKELKEKLVIKKAPEDAKQEAEGNKEKVIASSSEEDIIAALIEIKQIVRSELKVIKEEIEQLRKALHRTT